MRCSVCNIPVGFIGQPACYVDGGVNYCPRDVDIAWKAIVDEGTRKLHALKTTERHIAARGKYLSQDWGKAVE